MMKRLFCILLVFYMILSVMPVSAFAAETEETGELHTGHVHSEKEEGGEFAEVSTFDELESAIENGGRIKLMDNISSESLTVNCDVVLDLNGHDLDLMFFEIYAGGTLTVDGEGCIEVMNCLQIWAQGALNVLGGELPYVSLEESEVNVTISGGKVAGLSFSPGAADAVVNINGGYVESLPSSVELSYVRPTALTIISGTFGGGSQAMNNYAGYLAEHSTATVNSGTATWTVTCVHETADDNDKATCTKLAVCSYCGASYGEYEDHIFVNDVCACGAISRALSSANIWEVYYGEGLVESIADGGNIRLMRDITAECLDIQNEVEIDLNGYSIACESIDVYDGGYLSLIGEGNIYLTDSMDVKNEGTFLMYEGYIHGPLLITGGYFGMRGGKLDAFTIASGSVTIVGGFVDQLPTFMSTDFLIICGGTFGVNPTSCLAEGCVATLVDGLWTVTCNHESILESEKATCTRRAICHYCAEHYGDLNDHSYEDGICTVCSGACAHEGYTDGECDVCGTACLHESFADNKCESCGIMGGYCGDAANVGGEKSIVWMYNEVTGVFTIVGTGAMADYSRYDYRPWNSICKNVTTLTISEGITRIGKFAFQNFSGLSELTIPASVESLGLCSFSGCNDLVSVIFAENSRLTTIGECAFQNCLSLYEITLPSGVTDLAANSFSGTYGMVNIFVEEGNTAFASKDGVLYSADGTKLVLYPAEREDAEFTVPAGVTTIQAYAFSNGAMVGKLQTLILSDEIETIEEGAFAPFALTSVSVPCTWDTENPLYNFANDNVTVIVRDHTPDEEIGQICKGYCCAVCESWYGEADTSKHGDYSYRVEEDRIHALCGYCGMIDGYLALIAPEEGLVYDGTEKGGFTVEVEGSVRNETLPEIVYSGDRVNVTEEGFNASITLGGVTLTLNVKIQPKELTIEEVIVSGGYYGDKLVSVYDIELGGILSGDYVYFYPDYAISEGSEIGQYTTVKGIVGGELSGDDAANYCLPEGLDTMVLPATDGINDYYSVWEKNIYIVIHDQIIPDGQELDPNGYTVEDYYTELPVEGFTFSGITLTINENDEIVVLRDDEGNVIITITNENGEDVTDCFSVYVSEYAKITRTHEGHELNADGFCATKADCKLYDVPFYNDEIWAYEITNAGQLYWFANYINNENNSASAILMNDIVIPAGAPAWEPIMNLYGEFDGNFKTISGLYVSGGDNVGMFGGGGYAYGTIKNLHISNSTFIGDSNVGGLAGYHAGAIENCYVDNTVTVTGNSNVGGLVGSMGGGYVMNCYAYADSLIGSYNSDYTEIINSYYLSETETEDGGKTAEQFKNGEVAYLLQAGQEPDYEYDENWNPIPIPGTEPEIWGQTCGTGLPAFGGAKVYQGYTDCDLFYDYSNDADISKEPLPHTGELVFSPSEDGTTHMATYDCCGTVGIESEAHNTFDSATGKCKCGALIAAAKIDDVYYLTFVEALENWTDGKTLILTNDVTHDSDIKILEKSVILDLNGNTLNLGSYSIRVGGVLNNWEVDLGKIMGALTVRDSGNGGAIDASSRSFYVYDTLLIESGTINKTIYLTEYGTLNMIGGTIRAAANRPGVENYGQFNLSGGVIIGRYGIWNYPGATVVITGSPVITGNDYDDWNSGAAIFNMGTITISGNPVLTGGSYGEIAAHKNAITLHTQPADGVIWRIYAESSLVVIIPGEGVTLDLSMFAPSQKLSAEYELCLNADGNLVVCKHSSETLTCLGYVCDSCGNFFGEGDKTKHNYDSTEGKCTICGEECEHTFSSTTGKCTVCGKDCEHSFNSTSGKCTVCEMNLAVAKLVMDGKTIYLTELIDMRRKMEEFEAGALTLLADCSITGHIPFEWDCSFVLNLNGFKLTNSTPSALFWNAEGADVVITITGSGTIDLSSAVLGSAAGRMTMIFGSDVVLLNQALNFRQVLQGYLDLSQATIPAGGISVQLQPNAEASVSDLLKIPVNHYFVIDGRRVDVLTTSATGTVMTHTQHNYDSASGKCMICDEECEHTSDYENGKCTVCGMACAHSMDPENGLCSTCEMNVAVALVVISGKAPYYVADLSGLTILESYPVDVTITLLCNSTTTNSIMLSYDGSFTLDTNGYTLTHTNGQCLLPKMLSSDIAIKLTGNGAIDAASGVTGPITNGSLAIDKEITLINFNRLFRQMDSGVFDLSQATIPESGYNVELDPDKEVDVSEILKLPKDYYFIVDGKAVYRVSERTVGTVLLHDNHVYDDDCDSECNVCGEARDAGHLYNYVCDTSCVRCGKMTRPEATAHISDSPICCDGVCQYCAMEMPATAEHDWKIHHELLPTCGKDGENGYTCSQCLQTYYETVPATGAHTYRYDCDKNCSSCYMDTRPEADHKYDNDCDPSCNFCGDTRWTEHEYDNVCDAECNKCGDIREGEGHVYEYECSTTCLRCDEETRPEAGHTNRFAPCETVYCNYCNTIIIATAEHNLTTFIPIPPSCLTEGLARYECTNCDYVYAEPIPATGEHEYDHIHDAVCNLCGTPREVEDHTFVDGVCECGKKEGSYGAPATAKPGDNTIALSEDSPYYYWKYIAEKDGVLLVAISGEQNWRFSVENCTNFWYENMYSDSDPVVNPMKVPVSLGDEIIIYVEGYDPQNPFDPVGGNYTITLEYQVETFEIVKQPVSVTGTIGETVSVKVEATGEGLTYQWYLRNAGSKYFSPSSITTADYTVTMDKTRAGRELYCIITDANGNTLKTDVVTIYGEPTEELEITTQPEDAFAKLGERYCVTVEAQGDRITYQWYFRKVGATEWNVSSVKDNTYDDVMNGSRHNREVYCVITDAWGNSVSTDVVTLTAIPEVELEIIQQPGDSSAKLGEGYCVTILAQGDNVRYTWYWRTKGSTNWNKSGVTDNTYDDEMTIARHNREVYCVVTDGMGNSVTSEIATITATPTVELEITKAPESQSVVLGTNFNVVVEAQGEGLRYQWYYRKAGTEKWSISGQRDNTYDDVMTKERHNREVKCVITDMWGNTVSTESVIVTIMATPSVELGITAQPENEIAKIGENFCVTVEAQGDGLKYQWYWRQVGTESWTVSGQRDNTYDDVMTKARHNREVKCVITDMWGDQVETEIATITATPSEILAIVTEPTDAFAAMGENYCVTVEAVGDGLTYTWYFKNAGSSIWHTSGVKDNTYDDEMITSRAGREVYCVITDIWGNTVTTNTVTLVCVKES